MFRYFNYNSPVMVKKIIINYKRELSFDEYC